jgi:hypothetical protein
MGPLEIDKMHQKSFDSHKSHPPSKMDFTFTPIYGVRLKEERPSCERGISCQTGLDKEAQF